MKPVNIFVLILAVIIVIALIISFQDVRETGNAISEEPIKVGVVIPMTGKLAVYGERVQNGLELALDEINSKGGVNGRMIELTYEDNQGESNYAVSAAHKLIDIDDVKIIIGPIASSVFLSVAPIAEQEKIILFTPGASSSKITDAGDYVFRNRETGIIHGQKTAELAIDLGLKKAALLYVNADNGITYGKGFIEEFEKSGGEIVYDNNYVRGETDFRTSIAKIESSGAELVYLPGYVADIALIIKQSKEFGLDIQLFSSLGAQAPNLFEIAGDSAEGLIYPAPIFDPQDPSIKDYLDAYKIKYGEESEFLSANSYDALKILALMLEKCGEDTTCIKEELYKVKNYPGVGGLTTFDENGDVEKPLIYKQVKNQEFVRYEK